MATAITPIGLTNNTVNVTKRKLVTATPSSAGSSFAIATSLLGDYSKVVLCLLTTGSTDSMTLTVKASSLFTNGDDYVATIDSSAAGAGNTVGSTSAYNFLGPFDSAHFKTTNGLHFTLASDTAGDSGSVTVFALGLPNYK